MRAKIPNRISSRSVASVTPGLLGTYCGWESGSIWPLYNSSRSPTGSGASIGGFSSLSDVLGFKSPVAVDVSVHAETGVADSVHDDTRIMDSVPAGTGTVDSAPAPLEQPKALPGDEE